jgi:hypothetical protein
MRVFIVGFTLSLIQLATAQTPEDILLESRNTTDKSADVDNSDRVQQLLRDAHNDSQTFKPTQIVLAVNALHAMGKKRAIEELEKHLGPPDNKIWDDDHVFIILRLLFEPINPTQPFPVPMNAAPRVHSRRVASEWPLNPVELIGGIPFRYHIAMGGYSGSFETAESHLDFVKQACVLRDRPLTPSIDPITAANALCESQKIRRMDRSDKEEVIASIQQQANSMLPPKLRSKDWSYLSQEIPKQKLKWNPESGFQLPKWPK